MNELLSKIFFMSLCIEFAIIAISLLLAVSVAVIKSIHSSSKYNNKITYISQDGSSTEIDIPNDAYYEGHYWERNCLKIVFDEG